MVLLSIGYTAGKCDLYEKLNELSSCFKESGINIGLVESDSGSQHFIKCVIRDEDGCSVDEIRKSFNIYVSNILYGIIVDNFEMDAISKIIKNNYYYFKSNESEDIARRCVELLKGSNSSSSEDYMIYINRKNAIVNRLNEYLNENTDIVLEGFLRFRLKDMSSEIEDVVDKVVEEYLIEREYNEFIKLLRYFVEIQESRIGILNIVINMDGSFCMYDDKNAEITDEMFKELMGEGLNGEKNNDDLLVSSLITMAPRFIIIHNASYITNKEIIETIKNVFPDRMKECPGCDLCEHKSPAHKM